MKVTAYKTDKITSQSHTIFDVLDAALPAVTDGSIVAIAAKIVSLCEGSVASMDIPKDDLIRQESQRYLPRTNRYDTSFTITRNLLVAAAGMDETNADSQYILWPKDSQASANAIREHLAQKHDLQHVGVIITDSTLQPMQWGTIGRAIAYSGFQPIKDYIGHPDLFGRIIQYHKASLMNGLAAAAATLMGEGDEQTPIALIEDLPDITFQDRNPTEQELADLLIEPEDDLFWPLMKTAPWEKGLS